MCVHERRSAKQYRRFRTSGLCGCEKETSVALTARFVGMCPSSHRKLKKRGNSQQGTESGRWVERGGGVTPLLRRGLVSIRVIHLRDQASPPTADQGVCGIAQHSVMAEEESRKSWWGSREIIGSLVIRKNWSNSSKLPPCQQRPATSSRP